jgi:hypothetical protein
MRRRIEAILYVGMGDHRDSEAAALRQAAGAAAVTSIVPSPVEDTVEWDGRRLELGIADDRAALVAALDLDGGAAARARDLLERAEARDVVAGLLLAYRAAERGGRRLERVVVSGHSGGEGVYAESRRAVLRFEELVELARLFPVAAAQVEDVMYSACNSGWPGKLEAYHREAFPRLKTLWAYAGVAPEGGGRGAEHHMRAWERLSRGDAHRRVDRNRLAPALDPRGTVATWNVQTGFRVAEELPLEAVLDEARRGEPLLEAIVAGGRAADLAAVRRRYDALQALVGHRRFAELPLAERTHHQAMLRAARELLGIH